MVYLSGAGLPRLSLKNGHEMDVVVVVYVFSWQAKPQSLKDEIILKIFFKIFRKNLQETSDASAKPNVLSC